MADCSAPEIKAAYDDVRNDKLATNWLLVDYETDKSDKLVLTATGEGGVNELKTHLQESRASFGYARITFANDKESQREKFVLIIWIGSSVKVMRKAKLSVHAADVKRVLSQYAIDVPANSIEDVDEDAIVTKLRKAGGANYGDGKR